MSFVSFKRQLSAELESFSSWKKASNKTPKSSQPSSVRLLGDIRWNAENPVVVSRFSENISSPYQSCRRRLLASCPPRNTFCIPNQPRSIISGSFPRTRPPSRQVFPPLHFSICSWINNNEELPELSTSGNDTVAKRSSNTPLLSTVLLPGRRYTPDLEFPMIDLTLNNLSKETFSCESRSPPGREYGPNFRASDRKRQTAVKLVVSLPKTEDGDTPVVFSYKHGKMRIGF